jgi:hypothetical protein
MAYLTGKSMRFTGLTFGIATALMVLPLAFELGGCFTEVGNAEDDNLVKADFHIDYSPTAKPLAKTGTVLSGTPLDTPKIDTGSIKIHRFYLVVREAEYHNPDGTEQHLWREDSAGAFVDFTHHDSNATLPFQNIAHQTIANLKMEFSIPPNSQLKLDTVDVDAFHNPGFIVGTIQRGSIPTYFLFALPSGVLHLLYSQTTLESWMQGKVYNCQFQFFAGIWLANARLDTARVSLDRSGTPFILLDSTSNTALHKTLVDQFYKSFNTLNTFINQEDKGDLN